ncbi:MAG: aminopeptidase P family protein [Alphaproteobacteria bacterium]|nr:aminopeptidase P family protein [Alphaproteobacteria bacterium]
MTRKLHFTEAELADRRDRACRAMQTAGLDGLLCFRQESMFWLTGYDTFGFVFFQCLFLGADGTMVLLTRAPDRLQAAQTSVIEDVRIWVDAPDAGPAEQLRAILEEKRCRGKRLGVEWEAYGLTARNGQRLSAALDGFCTLADASDLVSHLRVVKSEAELAYVRRAAALADEALAQGYAMARPGADEGEILAAMQGAVLRGGGDEPANEQIIGSGPHALLCRTHTGRRRLDARDMLTIEFAGSYRHYHAAVMRTLAIGGADPRLVDMHKASVEALHASEAALRPGRPIGEVFDAHARVLDAAGYREMRMNACGYSLGNTFAPNWMDWPMFYRGQPYVAEVGNVFFIHIIVFDAANSLAMTLGRTSEVTPAGARPLSSAPLALTPS